MGGVFVLLVAGVIAAAIGPIRAEAVASATACRFKSIGTGVVRDVTDGQTILLADGREIRLDAIEVPHLPAGGETGPGATAGLAARTALASLLAGQTVELRHRGATTTDRYGRILAYAYVASPDRSAAHDMLARGFARVAARVGDRACAAELLARERAARDAGLGLWAEPYYSIAAADSGAALLAGRGRFTVAQGKVLSVRESGGTIYMNFGRRWSEALTVTVLKRQERIFTAAGIAPKGLENRHVRVRGWVEERNGPRIEASNPEQLEIVERN
jgi:endonuclease YncB( thermonuclease family)